MYETYYGFSQPPFGLTPDVRFCYEHRSYTRAKAYMQYAVMREEGFLVVTGRPGMGKTTLIQDLLAQLGGEDRSVARIDSTQLDADDLLRLVSYAFGLSARGLDKATLLHGLEHFLRRRADGAGTAILVVDEAQNLPDRSLEELRLITNLQQGARALIQIFLVGQESLRELIHQHHLEQLQQRIVAACHLEPLDLAETRAYIRHRLQCAGWSGDPAFEADALRLIHQASGGVPRLINKVCDRLLLYGSVDELHVLRGAESRSVIEDLAAELSELPDGGLHRIETLDPGVAQAAIEDLVGEPGESPARPPSGGESEARPAPGHAAAAPSPAREDGDGVAGHPGSGLAAAPSTPDARVSAERARALDVAPMNEAQGELDASDGAVPAVDPKEPPTAPSREPGFTSPSATREPVDRAARSPGHEGAEGAPRRRLRLLPYVATAAMLLGVGSLLLVLQGRTPDEVAARVSAVVDRVARGLESFADRAGTARESMESDRQGAGKVASVAAPQAPTPELDPIGLVEDVEGAGGIETEALHQEPDGGLRGYSPDQSIAPLDAPEPPGSAAGEQGDTSALMGSDGGTLMSDAAAPGGETPAPGAPEPPVIGPWGQSQSSLEGAAGLAEPVALAEDQTLTSATGAAGSVDPGDEAGGIPLLEEELRRLGHRVRDLGDGRLSFDLAEQVPFASDSARMPERAGEVLDPLAAVLARYPEVRITLVGHTDSRGPADYNRRLSLSRARAVADYLQRRGVPEHGLATQGMGKEARLPEHESAARRRRVEVVIEPAAR